VNGQVVVPPGFKEAWVELFDERAADFPLLLESMLYLGFLLGTQGIIDGGRP